MRRTEAIYAEYNQAVRELGPYFTRAKFEWHIRGSEHKAALLNLLDGIGPDDTAVSNVKVGGAA